jgi:hypothetical protein
MDAIVVIFIRVTREPGLSPVLRGIFMAGGRSVAESGGLFSVRALAASPDTLLFPVVGGRIRRSGTWPGRMSPADFPVCQP